jgi:hypothetical protein
LGELAEKIRETLKNLLLHAGIEPSKKYHEALTEAWIMAVWHYMNKAQGSGSADQFVDQNPEMLRIEEVSRRCCEQIFSCDLVAEPERFAILSYHCPK